MRKFKKVSYENFKKDFEKIANISDKTAFKKIYDTIAIPQRATSKSSGYDFSSPFSFNLEPNEQIQLPLGIKAYMNDDEELLIFPRSSIGFKYNVKINNTIGKIDSDFVDNPNNEGDIQIKFTNTGNKVWNVKAGDRIAQGTFYKYLITDDDIPLSQERIGGIGSTNETK